MQSFELLLRTVNDLSEHSVLDLHSLFNTQCVVQTVDSVTAEDPEKIIIQSEEELCASGISLTTRTSLQLIIDSSGLMSFRTDDKQAAESSDLFGFRLDLLGFLCIYLSIFLSGFEDYFVISLIMSRRCFYSILVIT